MLEVTASVAVIHKRTSGSLTSRRSGEHAGEGREYVGRIIFHLAVAIHEMSLVIMFEFIPLLHEESSGIQIPFSGRYQDIAVHVINRIFAVAYGYPRYFFACALPVVPLGIARRDIKYRQNMVICRRDYFAGSAVDGHNTALPIATHLVIYAPAIARWPLASVVEHIIHIIISIQTVEITVDHFAELDFHQMYRMFRRRIGVFGPCEVSYRDVVIPDEAVFKRPGMFILGVKACPYYFFPLSS